MAASFRPIFNGVHRQLRLRSLRLGQDWQVEVRPLALTHQPPKLIDIKDSTGPVKNERPNKLDAPNLPPPVP